MKTKKYLFSAILLAVIISAASSSCYKIFKTHAPKEVNTGETFEVKMVVIDNGDSNQKEVTDWSVAAIRVPEDWDVKCGAGTYKSYAEDWVYYSDGKPANASYTMRYSEDLSNLYNQAAPKEGYKWFAYASITKVTKFMSACWRNGCDSAVVTFTVTAGNTPGDYEIDYVAADSESEDSPRSFKEVSKLKDNDRMLNASTIRSFKVPTTKNTANYANGLASKITVRGTENGIESVKASSKKNKGIYTLDGKKLSDGNSLKGITPGTYIIDGKKTVVK